MLRCLQFVPFAFQIDQISVINGVKDLPEDTYYTDHSLPRAPVLINTHFLTFKCLLCLTPSSVASQYDDFLYESVCTWQ